MPITSHLITADELIQMPDDGFRYELVAGELQRMSPAGHEHGRIVLNLSSPLHQYARTCQLGIVYAAETGFKIKSDPDTVRAPDIAFVCQERVDTLQEKEGYWPGAPDLAVEVISPGDLYTEVEAKVLMWLEAGTRLVIVVNPRKRTVTLYRSLADIQILTEDAMLEGGDILPGWNMPVYEIFA